MDGRYNSKGEVKQDTYTVQIANPGTEYDFIFLSVRNGLIKEACENLERNDIRGTLVFFCNFWTLEKRLKSGRMDITISSRSQQQEDMMEAGHLEGVLFEHLMLESERNAQIPNYAELISLFTSADLKCEIPHDMIEWIWIHMAINSGVTSTAARSGN